MSDVAKLARVSTMTVSRVLNKNPNVSDSTRERVFVAVERLRYQPNELARSLREQRSRQIGIIVPNLFDPFFAICAHEISTVARRHSYSVVLSTSNEDSGAEFEEASRMLRRNVDGLVLIPAHPKNGASLLLDQQFQDLPIVTLDRPIEGSRFDSVLVENERGAQIGTEHLIALGHRRIAYLGLSSELFTMNMRHRGYTAAMKAAGLRAQSVVITDVIESALTATKKLLEARYPPTALFCANNLTTRNVLHSLQALGVHTPDDVALVGFDDFETADLLRPGITVVRQPSELLGRTAAEMLFARFALPRRSKKAQRTVLPVDLVVRGSCGGKTRSALTA